MRMGLIGVGRIGAFHLETLAGLPAVQSVLVTDADTTRARELAGKAGATAVDTVTELFAEKVDGVVIAAPTNAHASLIAIAAAAGVPVFCEKPVAPDVVGTREVLEQVAKAGVPLQVGFQRRFDAG